VSFNHIYEYIDDDVSIDNNIFHNYVHLIYPDELHNKDKAEYENVLQI
jgi:hypothetical protein